MSSSSIRVVGLNEFRKGLRGMDRGLPKSVRVALNDVADVLIDATRPKIPRRTGAAAASLKAQSTQSAARISVGGTKAPYYPWLDFGGKTGRRKSVVRPFYRSGRYIYPTLAEQREAIQDAMLKALAQLAATNGIEVD
jgi:hypothetical protein